jgi:hypothetical protein
LFVLLSAHIAAAQQIADRSFKPRIASPAFAEGAGPLVAIDEAHYNFHTATGRYQPFADFLRRDGFVVRGSQVALLKDALNSTRVLVIANALHERNARGDWSLPTPSAFTSGEIAAIKAWVQGGGSLLLIVDHMPFPGANQDLAAAFGFTFSNGFAQDAAGESQLTFKRADSSLADHVITRGRSAAENIAAVTAFTGSAFRGPPEATVLFTIRRGSVSLEPMVAWKFDAKTRRTDISGWAQGAVLAFGKGRVALFGEAAMFSAQVSGPGRRPMGMNSPLAKQNPQFLLNVMHWLIGVLD